MRRRIVPISRGLGDGGPLSPFDGAPGGSPGGGGGVVQGSPPGGGGEVGSNGPRPTPTPTPPPPGGNPTPTPSAPYVPPGSDANTGTISPVGGGTPPRVDDPRVDWLGSDLPSAAGRASKVRIRESSGADRNANPNPLGSNTRSPVTYTRPIVRPKRAFFREIDIGAGGTNTGTGQHAWFGLRRLRVPYETAGEVSLSGIFATLLPCDVAGVGDGAAANPIAWGTSRGDGAAIVIGTNLPIQLGSWTSATAHIPGLDGTTSITDTTKNSALQTPADYMAVLYFPAGIFDNTSNAPNMFSGPIPLLGGAARIRTGETLDVAFVCARQFVTGQTSKQICGRADITLYLSPVDIDEPWQA